jgi:hypothetical protein
MRKTLHGMGELSMVLWAISAFDPIRRASPMKWLGIMFMTASLAIAPGYGSAQQPAEKDKATAGQPSKQIKIQGNPNNEEFKFPENTNKEEFKFPENTNKEEFKFPEKSTKDVGPLPATRPGVQSGKSEQAEPAKNLSPKEKEYLKKTGEDLATLQQKIDALKVKKEFNVRQRSRSNRMIAVDLQKRALNARKQFAVLEKAPDMAYSGLKTEMDKTMLDLKKAYSDALQFFE